MDDRRERAARFIVEHLAAQGYEALYAGGFVRDMLLGCSEKGDIDIATNATPKTISSLFRRVTGVGEHFGVMLVIEDDIPFEVATFRSDIGIGDGRHPEEVSFGSAQDDAARRDFTINGLFYDPLRKEIIDFVNGRSDIDAKIVRAIGNPDLRFREDYLRLMRAVRFAARFGFDIEEKTWAAIGAHAAGIRSIAQERIFAELNKMLVGPFAHRAISLLADAGILEIVLPEVAALRGIEQPQKFHPEGDVFVHTVKALSLLNSPSAVAAWSTLLHDIGKPPTMTREDRIRFNNHDHVGAAMAAKALQRMRAPRSLIDAVWAVVDGHMEFMNVTRMRLSTLKRFLSRPTLDDELELHRVDCLASHGDLENYAFLIDKRKELAAEQVKPLPLVTGKDLIAMGFSPGPLFGKILREVYDLQLEETVRTKEEALAWIAANRAEPA